MKKRIKIKIVAIAFLLCGVCTVVLLKGFGSSAPGIIKDSDASGILGDNRELLITYVNTPSNLAISLLGLDGIVSDIKESAQTGIELTDECAELVKNMTDATNQYHQALLDFNTRFLECNERTLEVKQNWDIAAFDAALTDVLSAIKEYNELLKEYKTDLGG